MYIMVWKGVTASIRWATLLMFLSCCISGVSAESVLTLDGNGQLPRCEEAVRVANNTRLGRL